MSGVHSNLRAKLTEECEQEGFDRMTRKDQMPIDKALALLARERCPANRCRSRATHPVDVA
jgi:cobaltochelatase CobT